MDITPVRLSDFHRDVQHIFVLLKFTLLEIRDIIEKIINRIEFSSLQVMQDKLEQQPIVICFKNLAKIIGYIGSLWLECVLI